MNQLHIYVIIDIFIKSTIKLLRVGGLLAYRCGGHGAARHPRLPLLVLQSTDEEEGALRAPQLHSDEQELARWLEIARLNAERRLQRH